MLLKLAKSVAFGVKGSKISPAKPSPLEFVLLAPLFDGLDSRFHGLNPLINRLRHDDQPGALPGLR